MSDFVFQGESKLALDAKGRLVVPARHRELLSALAQSRLTLTKHPVGCLKVFPRPIWEGFRGKLVGLPMGADGWRRIFLGSAMDVEIDSASRVLVSPELRAAAGLGKEVVLLGMGNHLELWDRQRHAAHEAEVMQQGLPEALADFSF